MFRVYLIFGIIGLAKTQIPSIGFCPDYLPMSDFDVDSFLGKWYETERYFQFTDIVSRCVVTDYAKGPSGKIYVSNEVTNRLTGIKRVIDGTLELSGRVGEGKLNVKYSTTPLSSQATLTVLDTDYDNYAVVWSCSGFGLVNAQNAWVMTRERLPPGPVLQKVYGVLDKFKISRTFFVKTDQEGCALAASDINAANGITAQSTVVQATGLPQRKLPILGIPALGIPVLSSGGDEKQPVQSPEAVKSIPEAVQPIEDTPEAIQPIENTPEIAQPIENTPEIAQPIENTPEIAQPIENKPEVVQQIEIKSEVLQPIENSAEAVRSIETIKSLENNVDVISTVPAKIEEILPQTVNADALISEPVGSEVTNNVAVSLANAASEAVKSLDVVTSDVNQNVVEPVPIAAEPAAEIQPLQVAEVILENNSLQQTEPQLKSEIKQSETIVPENLPVPPRPQVSEVAENVYVPLKTAEEKLTVTESKTN